MDEDAPAERQIVPPEDDRANRDHPDDNNEPMVVQEHADAEDLYRDISIPNNEDGMNEAHPASPNGKRSTYASYLCLRCVAPDFGLLCGS